MRWPEICPEQRTTLLLALAQAEREDLDFRHSSLARVFGVRAVWLAVLAVFGVVTAGYLARQEALLAEALILAAFAAPISDMGGNTGSQSAPLITSIMDRVGMVVYFAIAWTLLGPLAGGA